MENFSQHLQNIINVSPLPMALVDTDMCYLAVSEKWISAYQLQQIQLIGKCHYEIFPEIGDRWKEIHRKCLQGIDQSAENDRFERADGSVMYLKWEVRHFLGADGKIAGMMMTSEDITQNASLLLNEKRFQLFMSRFPGLCWITGEDQQIKYANKKFYETLHLNSDVIGKRNVEVFGEEIAKIATAQNEQVLRENQGIEFQQTVRDAQGHPQVYKIYKFPFSDQDDGTMVGAIAFDITKSTLLRNELDKSEAQFKLAFEHSLIGMALVSPEGNLKRVNKSLCQMLGYSEQEMKNLSIQDLTYPADLAHAESMLNELRSGTTERIKCEKRYVNSAGNIIWVVIAATMLYDHDGTPLYYVSQVEDITRRKEIENDLVLSEKKYRTIFENVQDVFYQTDQNGLVVEISPSIEHYSGFPREEIIGKPVVDFYFYPHDRDRIVESLRTKGFVIDFEVRLKTKSQELRYASVNARLVIEDGRVIATEGSMRDVTTRKFQEKALKALNSELTASNEQKSKLLSIIGHDLRNPISGSLQLLELTLTELDEVEHTELSAYLKAMKDELSSANNLLEDLLDWAKSQLNSAAFNPVNIEGLQEVVDKSLQTIRPMAAKKQIEINLELQDHQPIHADRSMLETIIRNLVSNAVKFTPTGGKINVSATAIPNGTKFSVSDNGVGISKEKLAMLFASTTFSTYGTAGEKGTGLGLGLCYDFVARHRGQMWAESEIDEGSTFYFIIPRD